MYDQILVPVDGSDPATAALDHALDIAADHEATLHIINVADTNVPSLTRVGVDVVDALVQEGAQIVSEARERGEKQDSKIVTEVIQGEPAAAILEYDERYEIDCIVMGTRGQRDLGEYVLGNVTDQVVTTTETPVITVRAAAEAAHTYPYETVCVPTDGSDHASAAVERGADIAARHGAALHLLFVVDEQPLGIDARSAAATERLEADGQTLLDEAAEIAAERGCTDVTTAVQQGSVRSEIGSYAGTKNVDLIVMGTQGRTGLDQRLLGSITERVLRTAPVPVLTVGSHE
jgi:nucleotide-binding universal stress UspA family protein